MRTTILYTIKDFAEPDMIQRKFNKIILMVSVNIVFWLAVNIDEHNNVVLDTVICWAHCILVICLVLFQYANRPLWK